MGADRFLHYRILGPLGQGGMGEVFLAEDERLGRRVALKFLPQAAAADPEAQERLRREARSLASLSHPHIAAIHALESEGGRSCLVMEYVEGETLAAKLARRPLPVTETLSIGAAVAEALVHAHAKGVIHRDIKPANILVTPSGVAKLTDFGIAKVAEATRLTAEGFTPGTVAYMSPEQARGAPVDGRSDLFSLGAVVYEALTGVRAFAADRPEATLAAIQQHEPEAPSALRSGIPLELERIVLKCLKKDPAHRYQHADDLAADLRSLAALAAPGAQAAADAATVTSHAAGPPPMAKKRLPRGLVIPLAIALLAAVIYLLGPYRPSLKPQMPTAEAAEKTIAVLSFQNLEDPGDAHGAAPIATSLLTVGLGQSQVMPVLSAQRIHDIQRQMGKTGRVVKGTEALDVAKRAGASYAVTGYIYATEPNVVLAAEVASTTNGTVLTASKVQTPGGERGLFAAVDSLTASLRDGLARAGFGVHPASVDVASLTTQNPTAYRAYVRGLDQLYRSDWTAAAQAFRTAVGADSTFALAWYYMAVATWWNSDVDGARREVETALRLGNRLSGRDRDGLKALGSLVSQDYAGATHQYRALLAHYTDDKEFLYGLGEALFHGDGDSDEALEALNRATTIDPSFAVAYEHIVDVEMDRGNDDAAVAAADRLLRADPDNAIGMTMKANALFDQGDVDGGSAVCREGLARDPRNWFLGVLFANSKAMVADFDSSRIIAATTARSSPRYARPIHLAWQVFLPICQGRFGEAATASEAVEVELKRLEAQDPSLWGITTTVMRMRCQALLETGRLDEGVQRYRETLKRVQLNASIRGAGSARLVSVLIQAGRVQEAEAALRDYDKVLGRTATRTERANRNFMAGLLALAKGHPTDAVTAFRENLPSAPPGTRYWSQQWPLSRALAAAGDEDGAAVIWARFIRSVPRGVYVVEPFKAMIDLAKYYEKKGRRDEALTLYKRVAYQYRMAEPGVKANEEALAGIQRLSKSS